MPMNARLRPITRTAIAALALVTSAILLCSPASAAEKLRVGKAVPEAFSFVPLDIGMRKGFFAKNGLEIEAIAFAGDARMQQAMASDSLDIALGSGPAMAFIVKGSPIKGVAAMAGPPLLLAIVVRPDGPKTAAELRAKKISVSTAGSLTYWLVSETSRRQGWGPKGIEIAPMGALPGQIAAMKRGDIDGAIMDIGNAFELEKGGEGRILVRFTDIKDFHIHVIFATDKPIAERPTAVRGFLAGWFETIAFMRGHKAETVEIAKEVTNKDAEITARVYDELMPMFSDDGRFAPAALATLAKSYVELQLLPQEPDMTKLYTQAFLPEGAAGPADSGGDVPYKGGDFPGIEKEGKHGPHRSHRAQGPGSGTGHQVLRGRLRHLPDQDRLRARPYLPAHDRRQYRPRADDLRPRGRRGSDAGRSGPVHPSLGHRGRGPRSDRQEDRGERRHHLLRSGGGRAQVSGSRRQHGRDRRGRPLQEEAQERQIAHRPPRAEGRRPGA